MTPEQEVLAWLARLVLDGLLTEQDAADMLNEWHAGTLQIDIPTPPEERDRDDLLLAAAILAGALFGAKVGEDISMQGILALGNTSGYPNAIQNWWMGRTGTLSQQYATGDISFATYSRLTESALQEMLTAQHMGGYGTVHYDRLRPVMIEQRAYLQRFMDTAALRQQAGNPYSAEYLSNRLNLYGGAGRGEYFTGQLSQRRAMGGLIGIRYIAVDDVATCGPCREAQGLYAPDEYVPMPGSICLGGGHCRCRLEYIYAV